MFLTLGEKDHSANSQVEKSHFFVQSGGMSKNAINQYLSGLGLNLQNAAQILQGLGLGEAASLQSSIESGDQKGMTPIFKRAEEIIKSNPALAQRVATMCGVKLPISRH